MDTSPIDPTPNSNQTPAPRSAIAAKWLATPPWLRLMLLGSGVVVALVVPGLAGMMAVRNLLGIGEPADCRATLPADHSLSAVVYCADEIASSRTVDSLRDAIKLVRSIPTNDPLRATGDRRIEQWSQILLDLGETAYQAGELDNAMNAARTIPMSSRVYATASDRMNQWQEHWDKADDLYKKTEDEIKTQSWSQALATARELLKLDNRYWATTRYQELLDEVQTGKEQQKAEREAAEKARNSSAGQRLTKWEQGFEVDAVARLKRANELAQAGTLKGLRAAIDEAQQIYYDTPTYDEAQKKIDAWEQQAAAIEDRQHLDQAIRLANRGNETSLQAAIDEAFLVSPTGSLYEEARSRIDQWMDQLYRVRYSVSGSPGLTKEKLPDKPPNRQPPNN